MTVRHPLRLCSVPFAMRKQASESQRSHVCGCVSSQPLAAPLLAASVKVTVIRQTISQRVEGARWLLCSPDPCLGADTARADVREVGEKDRMAKPFSGSGGRIRVGHQLDRSQIGSLSTIAQSPTAGQVDAWAWGFATVKLVRRTGRGMDGWMSHARRTDTSRRSPRL